MAQLIDICKKLFSVENQKTIPSSVNRFNHCCRNKKYSFSCIDSSYIGIRNTQILIFFRYGYLLTTKTKSVVKKIYGSAMKSFYTRTCIKTLFHIIHPIKKYELLIVGVRIFVWYAITSLNRISKRIFVWAFFLLNADTFLL